jgi:hypothetical protein
LGKDIIKVIKKIVMVLTVELLWGFACVHFTHKIFPSEQAMILGERNYRKYKCDPSANELIYI